MVSALLSKVKLSYIIGALVVLFFFAKGGDWLLVGLNANWAYIVDQLGLPLVAILIAWRWLWGKTGFRLDWLTIGLITLAIITSHYWSFSRTFFNDEWSNIFANLRLLQHGDPVSFVFKHWREVYAWAPFTALFEMLDITRPGTPLVFSGISVMFVMAAAITGAWLAGVISHNRTAALIAGLLVGISPNTFASLPWLSNIQGDSFGIILTFLTVGIWITARRRADLIGILVALLALAATLKGGGAVRTATVGGLLIVTDIILFPELLRKGKWINWLGPIVVTVTFYLLNPATHQSQALNSHSPLVALAYLSEATARSLIPPTLLAQVLPWLDQINQPVIWVIVLGGGLFLIGTTVAFWSLTIKRLRIFAWGWLWFYLTIFYVSWLAIGFGTELSDISDNAPLLYGGYKYAYLPITGLYLALAVLVGQWLNQTKRWQALIVASTVALIGFHSYEFMKLDRLWAEEQSRPNRAWFQQLVTTIPPSTSSPSQPAVLIIPDRELNPMARAIDEHKDIDSIIPSIYPKGALHYYDSVPGFLQQVGRVSTPGERTFALGWDSGNQTMVDLSEPFRQWLKDPTRATWQADRFGEWSSSTPREGDFFAPQFESRRGDKHLVREPLLVSPELKVPLPTTMQIGLDVALEEKSLLPAKGTVLERVAFNTRFPDSILLPESHWEPIMKQWYLDNFGGWLTYEESVLTKQPYYITAEQFRTLPAQFTVGAVCNSDHGKLQAKDLVYNQELFVNELAKQRVTLSSPERNGQVRVTAPLPCKGARLHRLVILGPANFRFKINRLTISFPRP